MVGSDCSLHFRTFSLLYFAFKINYNKQNILTRAAGRINNVYKAEECVNFVACVVEILTLDLLGVVFLEN